MAGGLERIHPRPRRRATPRDLRWRRSTPSGGMYRPGLDRRGTPAVLYPYRRGCTTPDRLPSRTTRTSGVMAAYIRSRCRAKGEKQAPKSGWILPARRANRPNLAQLGTVAEALPVSAKLVTNGADGSRFR